MRLRYDPIRRQFEHSREYDSLDSYERVALHSRVKGWCRDWNGERVMNFALPIRPRLAMRPPTLPHMALKMKRVEVVLTEPPRREARPEEKAKRELMEFFAREGRMMHEHIRPGAFVQMMNAGKAVADFIVNPPKPLAPPLIDNPQEFQSHKKPPIGPRPKLDHWVSGDHFIGQLKKRGFRVLGSGCFSTVLAKPGSDKVIKVNVRSDNWLDYVVWAAKVGQAGRLAPKVYSYRRFNEGRAGEFYVAVVERMEYVVEDIYHKDRPLYDSYRALFDFINFSNDHRGIEAERRIPGGIAFGVMLRTAFRGQRLDLHGNNWMVRKDGSIACTDPLCDGKSTAPTRMRHRDLAALSAA